MPAPLRLVTAALALGVAATSSGAVAAAGEQRAPQERTTITISVTRPVVVAGQQSVVKGRVRPARAATRVALQEKVTGGWKNLGAQRVDGNGGYRFRVAPRGAGAHRYRVIRLPWHRSGTVSSRTATITTYRWLDVTAHASSWATWGSATTYNEPVTIAGVSHPRSVAIDTTLEPQGGFLELDLAGRRCAAFDATLGAVDGNDPGAVAQGRVRADGKVVHDEAYAVGRSDRVTLDVIGVDRLRIAASTADPVPVTYFGIGTPRLLCAT